MMEAFSIVLSPFVQWLGKTTVQASVLIGLILLVKLCFRLKLPVRWHYCLWLLLLVRLILPWSPQSRISIFNLIPQPGVQHKIEKAQIIDQSNKSVAQSYKDTSSTAQNESVPSQTTSVSVIQSELQSGSDQTSETVTIGAEKMPLVVNEPTHFRAHSLLDILPLLWFCGAFALAGYIFFRNIILWRAIKGERQVTDHEILELLEDCKMQMRIQTVVGIVITDKVKSPALFGFVRPRLLLPHGLLEDLDLNELQYVFLHELAHLKRGDIYVRWLTAVLQILHWFNPLIWLGFRQMYADQEMACDALAMSGMSSEETPQYGQTLVRLLERFSQPQYVPSVAGILEDRSRLERRMTMIAQFKKKSYQWSPLAIFLIVIIGCVSLPEAKRTGISSLSPTMQPAAPAELHGLTVRKVWEGQDVDNCGKISPDGKYLSYVDWDTGDLAVYEIATGKKRHLTNKGSWKESDEFADFNRWSPDSRKVVYAWYNQQGSCELRVIDIDGSAKPRILFSVDSSEWISPCDWSKDGEHILVWPQKKDGSELAVLSVVDGSLRVLKEFPRGRFNNAVFSSEGDNIVYDDLNGDIIILSVKSGKERTLVKHPANDSVLGWGADGKYLLFTSDRSGLPDIWAVRVEGGEAMDDPWLVKSAMGVDPPRALGTTTAGLFYFSHFPRQTDVYVTEIDPDSGNVVSPPREAINYFVGSNATPDYSPDGKYMAYVRKSSPVGNLLCIRSLETGEERSFRPSDLDVFGFPRWSPDGRSLLVIATGGMNIRTKNGEMGLYTVNAQTGESELIVKTQRPQRLHDHAWGTDEKSVVFVRSTNREDVNSYTDTEIVERDITGGKETTLLNGTFEDIYAISRSLHGRWLAVLGKRKIRNLRVIPLTGGEPRVVYTFEQGDNSDIPHAWSAKGKYILIPQLREPQGNRRKWDLCRIAVEDGKFQNLGLEMPGFQSLSMHPDGRHIAFSSSPPKIGELWVMENYLPKEMGK